MTGLGMESRKEFYYRLILLLLIMIIIILAYRLLDSLGLLDLYLVMGIPSARTGGRGEGRRMDLHRERDFVVVILIALFIIAILLMPMILGVQ